MKQNHTTTENIPAGLTEPLLRWYRQNARDLPWRHTDDPYRIWVSEIMLQQTRVAAVLGYYGRFLAAFPTVEALAAAPEDALLKRWEGLGYYSRARNLQKAARIVTERYGGVFPRTREALLSLPGIGDYTAGAVLSACFGVREAAVDGNVLRVTARLADCHRDVSAPAVKRDVRAGLTARMPREEADIRIFNQAMMELGATVCGPGGPPRCGDCPLAALCRGRARGTAGLLPVKAVKPPRRKEALGVFVLLRRDGRVALRRRGAGLLAGLWEFPNAPGAPDEAEAARQVSAWGLTPEGWVQKLSARHIFTHVEWHMTGYVLRVRDDGGAPGAFFWADRAALDALAVPSAFAKYLAAARAQLAGPGELPEKEGYEDA